MKSLASATVKGSFFSEDNNEWDKNVTMVKQRQMIKIILLFFMTLSSLEKFDCSVNGIENGVRA